MHALMKHIYMLLCLTVLTMLVTLGAGSEVLGASANEFYSRLMEKMFSYQPELPAHVLDQSIAQQGSLARMEKFVWKLMHAEPVKIALLGGSMTLRGAKQLDQTFIKQVHKWMEATLIPGCAEQATAEADKQDVERAAAEAYAAKLWHSQPNPPPSPHVEQQEALHIRHSPWYLNNSHLCNGSHIELLHLSVPAAGPDFSESCVLQHVPQDVDLVIIEFSCNDYMDPNLLRSSERMSYERMIRYSLQLKQRPAVLLFESYCWKQADYAFSKNMEAAEEKHELIAKYYGNVQVLSARSVVYDFLDGARGEYPRGLIYTSDTMHVAERGHRWYSDMIINYIRHIALNLATRAVAAELGGWHNLLSSHHPSHQDRVHRRLRAAGLEQAAPAFMHMLRDRVGDAVEFITRRMLSDEGGEHHGCEMRGIESGPRGIGRGKGDSLAYKLKCSGEMDAAVLKSPFFTGNEAGSEPGMCAIAEDFAQVVQSSANWQWVDVTFKNGYESSQIGAEIMLHVNMDVKAGLPTDLKELMEKHKPKDYVNKLPPNVLEASLIYLLGYNETMGLAMVSCSGLCSCESSTIDALAHQKIKATTPQLHKFYLVGNSNLAGTSEKCKITVRITEDPRKKSNRSYFKVMGITTSSHMIFHAIEIFTRDEAFHGAIN